MDKKIFSGKYEVEGEIARGGMGVVYKAVHSTLNRVVAIKLLHPQYTADAAFIKRFQREARAMARLDHEGVIRVFDVSEEQGDLYIVMEYFPGKDIKAFIIERGKTPPNEVIAMGHQVAAALAYAHEQGIIHRDIKPGNIMVDNKGRVKIADFGIAAATDEISVTATGQVMGTPEYMSPEQARGDQLDGRSDIYSLGVVLFEMLTGKTPYEGISRMAIVGKLLYEQKEFELVFPPNVPIALQDVIRSLLKRDPQERLPNAQALADRLAELSAGMGQALKATTPVYTTRVKPPSADESGGQEATAILERGRGGSAGAGSAAAKTAGVAPAAKKAPIPKLSPKAVPALAPAKSLPKSSVAAAPTKSRALLKAIVGFLILAGGGFYLYQEGYIGIPAAPPAPVTTVTETPSVSLEELQRLQKAAAVLQENLASAQSTADVADAALRVPELYEDSLGFKTRGAQRFASARGLVDSEKYIEAKTRFLETSDLLAQGRDGFVRAGEKALAQISGEKKELAQKKKEARARAAAKKRADRAKAAQIAKAQKKSVPKPVAPAKPRVKKKVRPDIEIVGAKLEGFKRAYEKRDINALRRVSQMSDGRNRFLQQLFKKYKTIGISIADFSLSKQSATAAVVITRLVDKKGNRVIPGDKWKKSRIVIRKEGSEWGKVIW